MTSHPDNSETSPADGAPARRRRPRWWLVLAGWAVILLGVAYLVWHRDINNALQKRSRSRQVATFTSNLPDCDKVEIFKLALPAPPKDSAGAPAPIPPTPQTPTPTQPSGADSPQMFSIPALHRSAAIIERRELSTADRDAFLALWRKQAVGEKFTRKLGHRPEFAFRASNGGKVVFETSVCFECYNFVATVGEAPGFLGIDLDGVAGTELQAFLRRQFAASP